MTEPPPYRTRTTVLFASEAPRAVVLRRGPRTHHRLILWNTDLDTFEPGQWMKGNVRLCDLSPSGRMLLYFAEQYHRHSAVRVSRGPYDPLKSPVGVKPKSPARRGRKVPRYIARAFEFPPPRVERGSWTAISKPPYFSALAIWPSLGRRSGGGRFKSEREIVVQESAGGMMPIANTPIPPSVRIISSGQPAIHAPAASSQQRKKANARPTSPRPSTKRASSGSIGSACGMSQICFLPATGASSGSRTGTASPPPSILSVRGRSSTCETWRSSSSRLRLRRRGGERVGSGPYCAKSYSNSVNRDHGVTTAPQRPRCTAPKRSASNAHSGRRLAAPLQEPTNATRRGPHRP